MTRWAATGAYFAHGGTMYCARCGRLPLSYDSDTHIAYCRHCDGDDLPELTHYPVFITDGEIMCGRCGVNSMTNTGPDSMLECPRCDLPPWEQRKLTEGRFKQLDFGELGTMTTFDDIMQTPDRPPRPADIVRRCVECRQTTLHYWTWKVSHWRARCPSCGHQIARVRERPGSYRPKRKARR